MSSFLGRAEQARAAPILGYLRIRLRPPGLKRIAVNQSGKTLEEDVEELGELYGSILEEKGGPG